MLNRIVYEFDSCPVTVDFIKEAQKNDNGLKKFCKDRHPIKLKRLSWETDLFGKTGQFANKTLVYIPKLIRENLVEWYQYSLKYSESERLLETIGMYFNWPGMNKAIEIFFKTWDQCQHNKNVENKKYGKVPLANDWDECQSLECVHIDMVSPWKIKYKLAESGKSITVEL